MRKHRFSRREFMSLSGTGLAGLACMHGPIRIAEAALSEPHEPDLIVFNAKVFTVDSIVQRAEAFAVKAGRFVAVGSTEDVKSLAGKQTQSIDAQQMAIVPG